MERSDISDVSDLRRQKLDYVILKTHVWSDKRRLHFGNFTPGIDIDITDSTTADVQDGGVDKVRTPFQTMKKFVVGEIQFVSSVALGQ